MEIKETAIPEVKIILPRRQGDHRGFFSETYNKNALASLGIDMEFVQDNHSLSAEKGVVRGLHFQIQPFAQDKLVRVVRGSIFDVAVDLRRSSPSFGGHVSVVLSVEAWNQLLIPKGFAHGFCTLEPDTEVIYKVSSYYSPQHDRGVFWADRDLKIPWPVQCEDAILSDKDKRLPAFAELRDFF
jgi:dTDP-4-dehydrorhamnose 3,5-epimerase